MHPCLSSWVSRMHLYLLLGKAAFHFEPGQPLLPYASKQNSWAVFPPQQPRSASVFEGTPYPCCVPCLPPLPSALQTGGPRLYFIPLSLPNSLFTLGKWTRTPSSFQQPGTQSPGIGATFPPPDVSSLKQKGGPQGWELKLSTRSPFCSLVPGPSVPGMRQDSVSFLKLWNWAAWAWASVENQEKQLESLSCLSLCPLSHPSLLGPYFSLGHPRHRLAWMLVLFAHWWDILPRLRLFPLEIIVLLCQGPAPASHPSSALGLPLCTLWDSGCCGWLRRNI